LEGHWTRGERGLIGTYEARKKEKGEETTIWKKGAIVTRKRVGRGTNQSPPPRKKEKIVMARTTVVAKGGELEKHRHSIERRTSPR